MEGKGTRRVRRISRLRWGRLREVNGLCLVVVKYHWLYVLPRPIVAYRHINYIRPFVLLHFKFLTFSYFKNNLIKLRELYKVFFIYRILS